MEGIRRQQDTGVKIPSINPVPIAHFRPHYSRPRGVGTRMDGRRRQQDAGVEVSLIILVPIAHSRHGEYSGGDEDG